MNLALLFVAVLIQESITEKIIRTTETPSGNLVILIYFIIILIGILVFFINKTIRPFIFGIVAFSISTSVFSIFYINKKFATPGEFETFKLRNANWTDNNFYLNIAFNQWYNSTEVTIDKCQQFDSVQARVDNGFFGMRTFTDEVKIIENSYCNYYDSDSINLPNRLLNIGDSLAEIRCFQAAIKQYTKSIILDPNNADAFNNRGLIFMATQKYENALNDFTKSAMLKYGHSDKNSIQAIDDLELNKDPEKLFKNLTTNKLETISELVKNFNSLDNFRTYERRIKFCMEKINQK